MSVGNNTKTNWKLDGPMNINITQVKWVELGLEYSSIIMKFQIQRNTMNAVSRQFQPAIYVFICSFVAFFISLDTPFRIDYSDENLMTIIYYLTVMGNFFQDSSQPCLLMELLQQFLNFACWITVAGVVGQWYNSTYKIVHAKKAAKVDNI